MNCVQVGTWPTMGVWTLDLAPGQANSAGDFFFNVSEKFGGRGGMPCCTPPCPLPPHLLPPLKRWCMVHITKQNRSPFRTSHCFQHAVKSTKNFMGALQEAAYQTSTKNAAKVNCKKKCTNP